MTSTLLIPGDTTALSPRRSPGFGMASPFFETRASIFTCAIDDNEGPPAIPIVSSRRNVFGNSPAVVRMIARGIRGPSTARAKKEHVAGRDLRCERRCYLHGAVDRGDCGGRGPRLPVELRKDLAHFCRRRSIRRQHGEQPRPIPLRFAELAGRVLDRRRERERFRKSRIDLERAHDQLARLAFETAVLRHPERIGPVGEQRRVVRHEGARFCERLRAAGKIVDDTQPAAEHRPAFGVVRIAVEPLTELREERSHLLFRHVAVTAARRGGRAHRGVERRGVADHEIDGDCHGRHDQGDCRGEPRATTRSAQIGAGRRDCGDRRS